MVDPFTVRVFFPDGDPDGVRLIDRMNWTGLGVSTVAVAGRAEAQRDAGRGRLYPRRYRDEDDDLPTLYIGQADGIRRRIDTHSKDKEKDFWDRAVAFVSTNSGLNRAHATWLEYALIESSGCETLSLGQRQHA